MYEQQPLRKCVFGPGDESVPGQALSNVKGSIRMRDVA